MNKVESSIGNECNGESQQNGTNNLKADRKAPNNPKLLTNKQEHCSNNLKLCSNGYIVNGIKEDNNSHKTENCTPEGDAHSDEVKSTSKKSKSKKRKKATNQINGETVEETTSNEATQTSHFLPDDFDILSILNSKYEDANDCKEIDEGISKLRINETTSSNETTEIPIVEKPAIDYVAYESELQMPLIMKIIQKDLSEPYSIYTYRYFIHNWPNLCFLAMCGEECVGAIVCKLDIHRKVLKRGYIAMLAVDKRFRKNGLGSTLVKKAIQEMIAGQADEVVLETEITNKPALRLYEALGFVRDKRLFRYYLNGVDALRLKLWLR